MLKRTLSDKLISLSNKFPVITITGPRQSGKTTLAKMVFSSYSYVSLEEPDEKDFAITDPKGFLRRFDNGVILDEIQRVPSLLSYIQGIVDKDYLPGKFILTGSHQFHLMDKISQSLAGRTAIVYLLPFSLNELMSMPDRDPWKINSLPESCIKPPFKLEDIIFKGLYPPIHDKNLMPHDWLFAYYKTYIERDVRDIINIANLEVFQRFIRLCAARCGQILNLSSLALDAGISHTTARNWISVMQASFIIHLLTPHYANFSKRIIKSPKIYFFDSGLLCYLLRIKEHEDIITHPMRGQIFENFVLSELFKAFAHRAEVPPLYFWRDRTGHEIDIIIDTGKDLIPVEIKAGETIFDNIFSGLRFFISLGSPASKSGVLIHGGDALYKRDNFIVRPWYCIY